MHQALHRPGAPSRSLAAPPGTPTGGLKAQLFVYGVMVGIPTVLWWLQNVVRKSRGLEPEPVGENFHIMMGAIEQQTSGQDGSAAHSASSDHAQH